MRPPIVTTKTLTTPGRDIKLTLALQPQPITPLMEPSAAEPVVCVPDIEGLFWLSDADGTFSETAEAAYLLPLPDQAAGPVLAVAGLIGETCGALADWKTGWDPASGFGGAPGVYKDGNRLLIWPKEDTEPGLLSVKATVNQRTYGPILLTLLRYECVCYGSGGSVVPEVWGLNPLRWESGMTEEFYTSTFLGPDGSISATVTGTWPPGTSFNWSVTGTGSVFAPVNWAATDHVLTLNYRGWGSGAGGTLTATVTATTPGGATQTVGPITFIYYPY